jgi:hypothetical protein
MCEIPPSPADDLLALKLADARRQLAEIDVPTAERDRLHRQFIAICDAIKIHPADRATGLRRLAAFMSTLDQAGAKSIEDKAQKDDSAP